MYIMEHLISFGIPGFIFQVEAIKFATNEGLEMLLSKPASQLFKYVHNDPKTHLQIFLLALICQSFSGFSSVISYGHIYYGHSLVQGHQIWYKCRAFNM